MCCEGGWRSWLRPAVFVLYLVLVAIALPLCIIELNRKGAPANVQAWFIGGLFTMLALPISLWTILGHLINYTKPHLQRYIIRILWMVPIYVLNAWFALRFPKQAIYLDTMRECYEAYVIYNFMAFLLSFLRHQYPDVEYMVEQKSQVGHMIPFCCFPAWPMGRPFIERCRHGALQYTVVRPIMTVLALCFELGGLYGEGEFNPKRAWPYLTFINNVSQVWALYCLILFYRATKQELQPMKPMSKFLCVKFVVFMSFWQSVLIAILAASGLIAKVEAWKMITPKEIANGLQDFAICIEMCLASVAHHYSFNYKGYIDPNAPQRGCCASFWSMWDVTDVKNDVVEHISTVGSTVRATLPRPPGFPRPVQGESVIPPAGGRRKRLLSHERTPLLNGDVSDSEQNLWQQEEEFLRENGGELIDWNEIDADCVEDAEIAEHVVNSISTEQSVNTTSTEHIVI